MTRYENILTMLDALSTKVRQPLQAQSKLTEIPLYRIMHFITLVEQTQTLWGHLL